MPHGHMRRATQDSLQLSRARVDDATLGLRRQEQDVAHVRSIQYYFYYMFRLDLLYALTVTLTDESIQDHKEI
jgi:hypothetical protein